MKKNDGNKSKLSSKFNWRPLPLYELISYVFMFASVPMLAYGIINYNMKELISTLYVIIALYSGFFAALIWNDITDSDIDSIVHPDRPIPSGKIKTKIFFLIAIIFSFIAFVFSYLISIWCFILVGIAALFVTFHNKYLKRKITIPAYSEIFTPLQWVIVPIFGFFAVNNFNFLPIILLIFFTYFSDNSHDLPEGIHDKEGDNRYKVKTYATTFGERITAKFTFIMVAISGIFGFALYFFTNLSLVYLISFLVLWIYILIENYKFSKSKDIKKQCTGIGRKNFNYFLFSYDLIFIDLLIQLIYAKYF